MLHTPTQIAVMLGLDLREMIVAVPAGGVAARPRTILPISAGTGETASGEATPASPTSIITVRRVMRGDGG